MFNDLLRVKYSPTLPYIQKYKYIYKNMCILQYKITAYLYKNMMIT